MFVHISCSGAYATITIDYLHSEMYVGILMFLRGVIHSCILKLGILSSTNAYLFSKDEVLVPLTYPTFAQTRTIMGLICPPLSVP